MIGAGDKPITAAQERILMVTTGNFCPEGPKKTECEEAQQTLMLGAATILPDGLVDAYATDVYFPAAKDIHEQCSRMVKLVLERDTSIGGRRHSGAVIKTADPILGLVEGQQVAFDPVERILHKVNADGSIGEKVAGARKTIVPRATGTEFEIILERPKEQSGPCYLASITATDIATAPKGIVTYSAATVAPIYMTFGDFLKQSAARMKVGGSPLIIHKTGIASTPDMLGFIDELMAAGHYEIAMAVTRLYAEAHDFPGADAKAAGDKIIDYTKKAMQPMEEDASQKPGVVDHMNKAFVMGLRDDKSPIIALVPESVMGLDGTTEYKMRRFVDALNIYNTKPKAPEALESDRITAFDKLGEAVAAALKGKDLKTTMITDVTVDATGLATAATSSDITGLPAATTPIGMAPIFLIGSLDFSDDKYAEAALGLIWKQIKAQSPDIDKPENEALNGKVMVDLVRQLYGKTIEELSLVHVDKVDPATGAVELGFIDMEAPYEPGIMGQLQQVQRLALQARGVGAFDGDMTKIAEWIHNTLLSTHDEAGGAHRLAQIEFLSLDITGIDGDKAPVAEVPAAGGGGSATPDWLSIDLKVTAAGSEAGFSVSGALDIGAKGHLFGPDWLLWHVVAGGSGGYGLARHPMPGNEMLAQRFGNSEYASFTNIYGGPVARFKGVGDLMLSGGLISGIYGAGLQFVDYENEMFRAHIIGGEGGSLSYNPNMEKQLDMTGEGVIDLYAEYAHVFKDAGLLLAGGIGFRHVFAEEKADSLNLFLLLEETVPGAAGFGLGGLYSYAGTFGDEYSGMHTVNPYLFWVFKLANGHSLKPSAGYEGGFSDVSDEIRVASRMTEYEDDPSGARLLSPWTPYPYHSGKIALEWKFPWGKLLPYIQFSDDDVRGLLTFEAGL